MQRRHFLQSSLASMLATGAVPAVVTARDKSGTKNAVIGSGEHRYECIHNWGEVPKHIHWETTHGVTVDAEGLVYIKQQGHGGTPQDTIVVFDRAGKFVRSFAKNIYPGGHGIDVRKEGSEEFLYLCDVAHGQVIKTTLKGEEVWKKVGPPPEAKYGKSRYSPTNVAFAPDGGFYIGDGYGSNFIHQYDKDAMWVRTFGGGGLDFGKMRTPHGLWVDDRPGRKPSLIVADRANARLQYFSLDGKHLGFLYDVLFPAHFDIRGDLLLVPDLHARVSLFDKDNAPIVHLGDDLAWRKQALAGFKARMKPEACPAGKFIHPHDACFDHDGNIFVVEWVHTGRVTLLKKVG
jgi:hypothetical protein